jgi:hypothetical protein
MSWPKDGAKTPNWRFRIAGDPEATFEGLALLRDPVLTVLSCVNHPGRRMA